MAVPHGDRIDEAIMAASIVAKVARDAEMLRLDALYPGYGFASNKGYGLAAIRALRTPGVCEEHRRTFGPVRAMPGWCRPVPGHPNAPPAPQSSPGAHRSAGPGAPWPRASGLGPRASGLA